MNLFLNHDENHAAIIGSKNDMEQVAPPRQKEIIKWKPE